jgi:2-haloacid dehalogenase
MSRIIVFDVNETLLDLKALDAYFERVFRAAGVREEWFKQVVAAAAPSSTR